MTRNNRFLLVRVRNLKGETVWTFPKGHLEPGETPRDAALREVLEETGYRCEILRPLTVVRYHFHRGERRVAKRVRWYEMRPSVLAGDPDGQEVLETLWASAVKAKELLVYPGDHRLLVLVMKSFQSVRESNGRG